MTISPIEMAGETPNEIGPRDAARAAVKQKLEGQKAQLKPDVSGLENTLDLRDQATAKTSDLLSKLRAQMEASQKQDPEAGINHPMA